MKNSCLYGSLLVLLAACTTVNRNEGSEIAAGSQTVYISAVDRSKLQGTWWKADDKEALSPALQINDTTVLYPDQEGQAEFVYRLKGDSMLIFFNGFTSVSQLLILTKDSLVLLTDNATAVYVRKD